LTLSFAPDGTSVAGQPSALFKTLDAQQSTAVRQQEILQALQTWAVQANINIGVVTDGGEPFGVAGPPQHDPRFGDIRVGAQAMAPDSLPISVPNDPMRASTWGGDVLINSNDTFGSKATIAPRSCCTKSVTSSVWLAAQTQNRPCTASTPAPSN
jgi:hypothetical protein